MANDNSAKDPLEFVRGMWNNMGFSLPGMITPTLDVGELDKRIADLKAVENWLKMNLSMLQMTTQGLEVQRAAIAAVQAMSQQAREPGAQGPGEAQTNPFASAAMWPWAAMAGTQAGGAPAGAAKPASATAGGDAGQGARKSGEKK
ncbi:PhaM family polyhydroxyalkanoate granule multifunctional regulatory protein [Aromatoleum evansii]|uniref:PhaM family polyhydroxyalkanoate granule multifunctional regulatory protein n=1 Tax=Aromatoleum evansii TaxID=59406 RepID=A0ABZ1AJ81_AROEV|nr:PhaM family polyhydroxyalkanoate granule multifunctional regulatory protein [Aromatoleum evansii]